jgi:N-acetylmuramoyl-L-alanine amidase
MKKIFLSPSNQSGNTYAYGNTNEAAVCGKIADFTENALKRCGFQVKTMQWETMQVRCRESDKWGADLHIPIHTNAFNKNVTGTRTMCYSLKGENYKAAQAIHKRLAPLTPGTSENISAHPELYELNTPKATSVYLEVDFHDVPKIAKWLIENTEAIGEEICKGVCDYYGVKYIAPYTSESEKPEEETTGEIADAKFSVSKWGVYSVTPKEGLWLRSGGSTKERTIELMKYGAKVICYGFYNGDWYMVASESGKVGFCHSGYLKKC